MKPTKPGKPRGTPPQNPTIVKIHSAKTTLSQLIVRVLHGERIVIARNEEPVAELVAFRARAGHVRRFGALRGVVAISPAFFEPLPEREIEAWGR